MASELQRVAQGLVDVLNEVPGVVAHLHRMAARCRENAALVMQLVGSRGAMAAQQLDAAAQACEAAANHLSLAPPKALDWARGLVAITPDATGRPDPRQPDRGPLRSGPGDTGRDEPAPYFEKIFRRLLERPEGSNAPTRGILTPADGRGMTHLISGRSGPGRNGPGLTGRTARLTVARDHVEGHAAALLRRAGVAKDATLYLNNKPCPGEYGCDATLEDQLPRGTKLTVYWPGGHKVYEGNGKGME